MKTDEEFSIEVHSQLQESDRCIQQHQNQLQFIARCLGEIVWRAMSDAKKAGDGDHWLSWIDSVHNLAEMAQGTREKILLLRDRRTQLQSFLK